MKPAAIVGWSGNGEQEDLARTALAKLPKNEGAGLSRATRSLLITGLDPITVARKLSHLPGAGWIAVGYEFEGLEACLSKLAILAHRYLREGTSFKLSAEVEHSEKEEGDVLMEATSTLLKSVKRTRVDERTPEVWFRIIMVSGKGACGVQLRQGPGGVPTSGGMKAACLVSGGYHSSVVAWMAALSGYSLTLVHARDDDESLRQVARAYAEISRRIDPSGLRLEVLEGRGLPGDRVASWLRKAEGKVFTGAHPECRGTGGMDALHWYRTALFPLLLLQEGEVRSRLDDLGLRGKAGDRSPTLNISKKKERFSVRSYGGKEVDLNAVLDSILG